jgi:hypothetical protein
MTSSGVLTWIIIAYVLCNFLGTILRTDLTNF